VQKIGFCLWFDNQAEEAVRFYTSVFRNSKTGAMARYGDSSAKVSGRPTGSVMTAAFEIEGQRFLALNGGPIFKFTPAISIMVDCKDQAEVDDLWARLCEGGEPGQCGWLTDKFGVSWQIIPSEFGQMMSDKDTAKVERMMKAMLTMKKLDIAALRRAAEGT
jgi:predicted 3-demethylubiquinone-9 3-methyltransferase (glyoxalase superfamily)